MSNGWGQRRLTLAEVQAQARDNSPVSQQASSDFRASARSYDAFLAGFRPQVSLFGNLPGFTRSISAIPQPSGVTEFLPQNQTFSSARLSVTQPIALTGGQITLFSSLTNFNSFNPNPLTSWQTVPLGLNFTQPLFQLNRFKWDQREESIRYDLAELQYVRDREEAAAEGTRLFFDALIARFNLDRARFNVINNDTIYQLSQGRFSVGRIAENELLQSELSLVNARADSSQAALAYEQALQRLATFLGNIPDKDELSLEAPGKPAPLSISPDQAVKMALKHSERVPSTRLQRLQAEREVREIRNENRFNLDLNASFGLNQTGNTVGEAYQDLQDQEAFSLGVSVPLLQWGKGQAELEAAQARQRSTALRLDQLLQVYRNDIYYRALDLRQLQNQLSISARADTVARRRYEISKNRYLIGKVSIQDLFIAQNERDAAQIAYLRNLRALWLAIVELRAETLYDFRRDEPIRY
jgi:outer membrane protein TolC